MKAHYHHHTISLGKLLAPEQRQRTRELTRAVQETSRLDCSEMTQLPTPNAITTNRHRKRQMSKLGPSWSHAVRHAATLGQVPPEEHHHTPLIPNHAGADSLDPKAKISSFPPRRRSKRRPSRVLPSPLRARFCCGFVSMRRSGCCIWMTGSCWMVSGSYPMIRYPWKRLPKRSSSDRRAETRMVD